MIHFEHFNFYPSSSNPTFPHPQNQKKQTRSHTQKYKDFGGHGGLLQMGQIDQGKRGKNAQGANRVGALKLDSWQMARKAVLLSRVPVISHKNACNCVWLKQVEHCFFGRKGVGHPIKREARIKMVNGREWKSLGGGFKYFLFSPLLEQMIQFD